MISGAHSIIYSTNPGADRAVLRDVFKLTHVDVGGGWLIFGLPPAEVAVHPSDKNDVHELYLMCDDVYALIAEMKRHNLACGPVRDQGWGLLTQLTLPGGGKLGIYQARHARPVPMAAGGTSAPKPKKKPAQQRAKKRARQTRTTVRAATTRARTKSAKRSGAERAGVKKAAATRTRATKTRR
jgi:hypothetical protein